MNKEIAVPYQISITNSNVFLLTIAVKKLNASEIGMKELRHKKDVTKKTLIALVQMKKFTALGHLKTF